MATPDSTDARRVMTGDELRGHLVRQYGRDYSESDDGYGDMEAEQGRGWSAVGSWGLEGWDLGEWPYVVMYVRSTAGRFEPHDIEGRHELMVICEGDRDVYRFLTAADRAAGVDYLFLWYAAGKRWAPFDIDRERLDAGDLEVDPKYRGAFSWERLERERPAAAGPVPDGPVVRADTLAQFKDALQ